MCIPRYQDHLQDTGAERSESSSAYPHRGTPSSPKMKMEVQHDIAQERQQIDTVATMTRTYTSS